MPYQRISSYSVLLCWTSEYHLAAEFLLRSLEGRNISRLKERDNGQIFTTNMPEIYAFQDSGNH